MKLGLKEGTVRYVIHPNDNENAMTVMPETTYLREDVVPLTQDQTQHNDIVNDHIHRFDGGSIRPEHEPCSALSSDEAEAFGNVMR